VTGLPPARHGIVGNGWYDRELAEVQFWKQSDHLVRGEKIWERLRREDPAFTCAKLFWWYNMHGAVDYAITPRPIYCADGRKVFDIYTSPAPLREAVKEALGEFPFPAFWGPKAGIKSSRWIAESAKWIEECHSPTLSLVYLPHLDYNLQRLGPGDPAIAKDLRQIDRVAGDLIAFYRKRGVAVIVLSEYGITDVLAPIHVNRILREHGWIAVRDELGREVLDAGASRVFAVADHQAAHVYFNDPALLPAVKSLLEATPGIERVLDADGKRELGADHERAGDLIAIAEADRWFSYYYWLDDALAPDFARCVDIHRKPGYDPAELFIDPAIRAPLISVGARLLRKKLGFRMLMDVIPLDATLVRGSHGNPWAAPEDQPVWIAQGKSVEDGGLIEPATIAERIASACLGT
jgi:predicted AlkP superfamily pyrophosphatase or phosphodiesterase